MGINRRWLRTTVASVAAGVLLTGCSANTEVFTEPRPSIPTNDVSPTATPDQKGPEHDPLATCSALFDGGAESIAHRAPELLADIPQSLDSTTAQPFMVMDSQLRAIHDAAPDAMREPIEAVRAPFADIAAAVTSGDSAADADTSAVADAVTNLRDQCVEAGFEIEDVEESAYGEALTSTRANLVKEVGQLAGIVGRSGETVVDFTLTEIVVDFECTADWAERPVNGYFLGLKFEIATAPELANEVVPEYWISSHDFSVWSTDGRRVNDAVGNSYSCLDDSDAVPSSIGPDETVTGWVVLDVPHTSGVIGYSWIGLDGHGGWEWTYGD